MYTYTHYIVTPEEYAVQRHEGAYVSEDPPAISVPVGPLPLINAPDCGFHLNTGVCTITLPWERTLVMSSCNRNLCTRNPAEGQ